MRRQTKELILLFVIQTFLASMIGVYAQDIAHYLVQDSLITEMYLMCLMQLTISSLMGFSVPLFIVMKVINQPVLKNKVFLSVFIVHVIIGCFVSQFSLFVLAMSCG